MGRQWLISVNLWHLLYLNFRNDLRNLAPQNLLPYHDFLNLGVELPNVDLLPRVLHFHISADGQVIIIPGNLAVLCPVRKVLDFLASGEYGHDAFDVLLRQPVVVCHLDELAGS